jgi:hypothetical protein
MAAKVVSRPDGTFAIEGLTAAQLGTISNSVYNTVDKYFADEFDCSETEWNELDVLQQEGYRVSGWR